jgi:hypothetical protein
LLARANGLLSMAASWVQPPLMLGEVQDRKDLRPSDPIASTIMRYWLEPATLSTLLASNRLLRLASDAAVTVLVIALGKFAGVVCDRYKWPLSSAENG